jgi:hypothetical protein
MIFFRNISVCTAASSTAALFTHHQLALFKVSLGHPTDAHSPVIGVLPVDTLQTA